MKQVDPRVPVSVTWVGKFKVSIYDQAAYDESLRLYPPDENLHIVKADKALPQFEKKKKEARYNWITPLDKPLKGRIA